MMLVVLDPRKVAAALDGTAYGNRVSAPGPGHKPGDRSMVVALDPNAPEGFLVHSFAGDPWQVCRAYVRSELGLPDGRHPLVSRGPASAPSRTIIPNDASARRASRQWSEAGDPRGTLVEKYLRSRDGLRLPDDLVDNVVRFHPRLWLNGRRVGAMVTLLRDFRTDQPRGIQRTFLDNEGGKLERKMLGRANGAAIKLDPDADVTQGLFIGEGFETCLAAYLAGFRPVWCVGSAGGIEAFPVLSGIDAITILAENDQNGRNERATQICADLWCCAGRQVFAVDPLIGNDFADVWREATR